MKNNLSVPISIVVAGLIIAGAIFFSNNDGNTATTSERESAQRETASIDLRPISDEDWILGSPEASIKIVEYSDPECPFCEDFHETMHQVIDTYGGDESVAWVYRHFPIEQLHRKAIAESNAFECAGQLGGNQKFWQYADKIYEITPSNDGLDLNILPDVAEEIGLNRAEFVECYENQEYSDEVQSDYQDAQATGGRGTPHSVMVLNDPIGENGLAAIDSLLSNPQIPSDLIQVSEDGTKISMSGALPFDMIDGILRGVMAD